MQLEGEFSVNSTEQQQHKVSLQLVEKAFAAASEEEVSFLQGLTVRLYHPKSAGLASLKIFSPKLYAGLTTPEMVLTLF